MSEAVAASQSQGEGVVGDGSDVALAKVLQEQEQAWLYLLQSQNLSQTLVSSGDDSPGTPTSGSAAVQTPQHDMPVEDWALAMEMQQQEYRQHAVRLAAVQQQAHGNVDVDSMTYESLSMLGDTVGTVKVGLSESCKQQLQHSSYADACSDAHGEGESTCVICQHDYNAEEQVCKLPCKHMFHGECINTWLSDSKVCPVCMCEIPPSNNSN